jgi:hypothetical protein
MTPTYAPGRGFLTYGPPLEPVRCRRAAAFFGLLALAILALLLPVLAHGQDVTSAPPAGGSLLVQVGVPVVVAILTGIVSVVGAVATRWLLAKSSAEKEGSLQRRGFSVLAVLTQAAASAVQRVESNLRPGLGKATADGKLTPDEMKMLKDQAIQFAMAEAKATAPELLKAAGLNGEGIRDMLEHLVEGAAARLAGQSRQILTKEGEARPPVPAAG